jgi:hypothetical protein
MVRPRRILPLITVPREFVSQPDTSANLGGYPPVTNNPVVSSAVARSARRLITAGLGGTQADSIGLEGLRRGVAALEDCETVTLLQKALADNDRRIVT